MIKCPGWSLVGGALALAVACTPQHHEEEGIYPASLFGGYDGARTFRVPAIYTGEDAVTWSLESPALGILTTEGRLVTLAASASGTTRLLARTSAGETFAATVTITAYSPGAADIGAAIYGASGRNCRSCHATPTGPDHTPSEIGAHPDAELLVMVNEGKNAHGADFPWHRFQVSAGEQEAIIAYIRALAPRGVPNPHLHDDPAHRHPSRGSR